MHLGFFKHFIDGGRAGLEGGSGGGGGNCSAARGTAPAATPLCWEIASLREALTTFQAVARLSDEALGSLPVDEPGRKFH